MLKKSPFELSGGEKRRAAIAGVLAMKPSVLILDEPTAGLDPKGRDMLLDCIVEYQRSENAVVLLVSHSMEDIVKYSKTVLVMNKGKLFCHEDTDSVFSRQDEILGIGLDVPQITKIIIRLKELGINLGNDIYTIDRAKERILNYLK